MKKGFIIFVATVICGCFVFNTEADVAKPTFKKLSIPTAWRSVKPQQRLKALRVAQIDAYRALAERVYGFQLSSGSTVYNYMLESDGVRSKVDALLKGATEMNRPEYTEYGMVMVTYGVKLRQIVEIITTEKSATKNTVTKTEHTSDKVIEALGCGALPGSKAEKMLHAKRAAELDAYRLMAERFIGVKINSKTSVKDLCLVSDKVNAAVTVFLKGLKPTEISYADDDSCEVKIQLKIRETIKTIESFVKLYNDGRKDKITNISIENQDRIFTVDGHGAPGSSVPAGYDSGALYQTEKTIIRQVIKKSVVTD